MECLCIFSELHSEEFFHGDRALSIFTCVEAKYRELCISLTCSSTVTHD